MYSVGIDLKELGEGSDVKMFEILPRDWYLKPIFTQKWASVDMNWVVQPPSPDNSNPFFVFCFWVLSFSVHVKPSYRIVS